MDYSEDSQTLRAKLQEANEYYTQVEDRFQQLVRTTKPTKLHRNRSERRLRSAQSRIKQTEHQLDQIDSFKNTKPAKIQNQLHEVEQAISSIHQILRDVESHPPRPTIMLEPDTELESSSLTPESDSNLPSSKADQES